MPERNAFNQQLKNQWDQGKFVSIGLDADMTKLPDHFRGIPRERSQFRFLREIVEATAPIAGVFKPNIAFFEDAPEGLLVPKSIVNHIHQTHPEIPVIGDIKRADIGNTNRGYARAAFDYFGFDAITTNPYFGHDAFLPFTEYKGKGLIPLVKTSNPDSGTYQDTPTQLLVYSHIQEKNGTPLTAEELSDLEQIAQYYEPLYDEVLTQAPADMVPLYAIIARRLATLSAQNPNIGIVMGATHPKDIEPIRMLIDDAYMLIPGIGSQQGDLAETIKYAPNSLEQGMILNSGRDIIFASGKRDYAYAARDAAQNLHQEVTRLRARNAA